MRAPASAAVLACLLCWAPAAGAQQFMPTGRGTLIGLTGAEVVVEPLPPEVERAGLSTQALRADIEKRLTAGRVTVYASQRVNPSPAQAYLYVHVNALLFDGDARQAIAVQVQLRQTLQSLVTGSRIVDAVTWDAHNLLVAPSSDIADLREEIRGYVDLFIEDWTSVHQR